MPGTADGPNGEATAQPTTTSSPGSTPDSDGGERVTASFPGVSLATAAGHVDAQLPPLILPGGKVNPEAIRAAYDRAAEAGDAADGDEPWRVTFELQRDLQTRLDKYLTSRITFMSRSQLQRLIETGGVLVNGNASRSATRLRSGDRVDVLVLPPPSKDVIPQDIPLDVLHEDDHLIVLNKPADIIVHPARAEKSGTLINALAWHFRHRSDTGGTLSPVGAEHARPGVV
ncbi:MAG: S4 domain-containing protein, partial [Planctomycetota bacterium]